ncbi:Ribosomal RNA small subunit methyltransferase D [bioreactor metagenome]|uniref:Ribosomal RNA small subunit methyltransferase D n=1 Tax=bioreactor metagenome TaxID=1076179 RepID=A0A645G641_9ZZZZ
MRVITGTAKGRKLVTLDGIDVRPTTDRTKEAIFSIIQFDIEGSKVLDLFAGSGQLGIEALSRGAENAVFIDQSKQAINVINENLQHTGLNKQATVLNTNAKTFLISTNEKFNIAFLDPPYGKGLLQDILPYVEKCMVEGGLILCELPFGEDIPENLEQFSIEKLYKYGKTAVALYR